MVFNLVSFREFFPKMSDRDWGYYELERLKKSYDTEILDELVFDLMFLVNNGFYSKLLDIYANWDEPVPISHPETAEIASKSKLLKLARDNLKHSPVKLFSNLIDYHSFRFLYPFLEWIYCMNLKRPLTATDVKALLSSDIGERIVFGLDDFDKIEDIPEISSEFFQKLNKLKWKDRKAEILYKKFLDLIRKFALSGQGHGQTSFNVRQEQIVLFFAGCSAVNGDKNKINENNVVKAYKTLFKIIKTDISKFFGEIKPEDFDQRKFVKDSESLEHLKNHNRIESDKKKFWRGMIVGVFSCFFLLLYFDLWWLLIGGLITAYIIGGDYKIGARNGFIAGSVGMLFFIVTGMFLNQKINTMFVSLFTESYGFLIVVALVGAGLPAAVGGLVGIKIRRIINKAK